jgi:LPXTG-motif cell wall-anchored protein
MASRSGVPGQRQAEEAIVRKSVRNMVGVILAGLLGASALLVLGGSAGAQTAPAPPGDCVNLTVAPNPVPSFPKQVNIVGQAPQGVHIVLYANGVPATPNDPSDIVTDDVAQNTFHLKYTVTAPTDLSINFTYGTDNAYTAACATPGGEVVVRVEAEAASVTKPAPAAAALAFTGSSDTPSFVLIGIAAVVVGAVLVVAARRRRQVS